MILVLRIPDYIDEIEKTEIINQNKKNPQVTNRKTQLKGKITQYSYFDMWSPSTSILRICNVCLFGAPSGKLLQI